jgi:hypothetical protein
VLAAVSATGITAALAWPSPALAQTEADRLFDEGVAAFEREDYDAALAAFEGSYALEPAPDLLLNIGMCQRLVGRSAAAVNTLRRFVAAQGSGLSMEERVAIDTQIDLMLPMLGQVVVEVSVRDADVLIDGRHVGSSPVGFPIAVEPGEHVVEAGRDGFTAASEQVQVWAGGTATVFLDLASGAEHTSTASSAEPIRYDGPCLGLWLGPGGNMKSAPLGWSCPRLARPWASRPPSGSFPFCRLSLGST